jgi:potassium efflux system protein
MAVLLLLFGASPGLGWQGEPASQPQPSKESTDPSATAAGLASTPTETATEILRRQTAGQMKALGTASSPATSSSSGGGGAVKAIPPPATATSGDNAAGAEKLLGEVLQDRLRLLDEYDKASGDLKKAAHPDPSPEKQLSEAQDELARSQALLAQSEKRPETLLPHPERVRPSGDYPIALSVMKDELESTTNELKECKSKLETLRSETANSESKQAGRRTDRDKLFQRVTQMKARGMERDPLAGSSTARLRRVAQERLINAEWETRVEAVRLQAVEAELALEPKLTGVREVNVQVCQARIQVLGRTLALLQTRYRAAAERHERELKDKAAHEENRAERSDDPLERFRAHQLAELLKLEVQVVKDEQAEATSPPPSLDEQRSLADHTEGDFARIRELVDDGQVTRLDAIRLNNEFRRIGPERDRLLRNEMAIIEARLQFYEDALTNVEIELLQDSLTDRSSHDLLRERLHPSRWGEGESLLSELEHKHRALLVRRRAALERLTHCCAQTLDQISRRLSTLEEEYGFIRTHIFWVRDQEPIGLGTLAQGAREGQQVVKALLRLAQEALVPGNRRSASPEFVTAAFAALILPFGLVRLRRRLLAEIGNDIRP